MWWERRLLCVFKEEELGCLREMLKNAPDIQKDRMERLNDLLVTPLQNIECDVAIEKLVALLHNKEERNFAIYWLNRMATSCGETSPEVDRLHNEMITRLMGKTATSVPPFSLATRDKKKSNSDPTDHAGEMLKVWTDNIREHVKDLDIDDDHLNQMVTIGLLIAKVIMADNRVNDSEAKAIEEYFENKWNISKKSAASLSKILLSQDIEDEHDIILLCFRLHKALPKEEILSVTETIFKISSHPGGYNDEEMNNLVSITAALYIENAYFNEMLKKYGGTVAVT